MASTDMACCSSSSVGRRRSWVGKQPVAGNDIRLGCTPPEWTANDREGEAAQRRPSHLTYDGRPPVAHSVFEAELEHADRMGSRFEQHDVTDWSLGQIHYAKKVLGLPLRVVRGKDGRGTMVPLRSTSE